MQRNKGENFIGLIYNIGGTDYYTEREVSLVAESARMNACEKRQTRPEDPWVWLVKFAAGHQPLHFTTTDTVTGTGTVL